MANILTQPSSSYRPNAHHSVTDAMSRLLRDNVLRVGLVLVGMTAFIAAAEAKTPANEVDLTNLPQLVSQIANQSAAQVSQRINEPYIARQYLASDDYAVSIAPSNLVNSPAARFLAARFQ